MRAISIETIEDLMNHCEVDEFTDCWHWLGAVKTDRYGKKMPSLRVSDKLSGVRRCMTGPVAVLELSGRRTSADITGWRSCQCWDCMNPEHILSGTVKDRFAWLKGSGVLKNRPAHVAANRRTGRARATLTMDIAREIRNSPLSSREAAEQFGVCQQHVHKIRQGRVWKDTVMPGASVFSQRWSA